MVMERGKCKKEKERYIRGKEMRKREGEDIGRRKRREVEYNSGKK